MKIFQLDAATRDTDTNETVVKDQEAYDLTMWLESGVFEAVEKRLVVLHSLPNDVTCFGLGENRLDCTSRTQPRPSTP